MGTFREPDTYMGGPHGPFPGPQFGGSPPYNNGPPQGGPPPAPTHSTVPPNYPEFEVLPHEAAALVAEAAFHAAESIRGRRSGQSAFGSPMRVAPPATSPMRSSSPSGGRPPSSRGPPPSGPPTYPRSPPASPGPPIGTARPPPNANRPHSPPMMGPPGTGPADYQRRMRPSVAPFAPPPHLKPHMSPPGLADDQFEAIEVEIERLKLQQSQLEEQKMDMQMRMREKERHSELKERVHRQIMLERSILNEWAAELDEKEHQLEMGIIPTTTSDSSAIVDDYHKKRLRAGPGGFPPHSPHQLLMDISSERYRQRQLERDIETERLRQDRLTSHALGSSEREKELEMIDKEIEDAQKRKLELLRNVADGNESQLGVQTPTASLAGGPTPSESALRAQREKERESRERETRERDPQRDTPKEKDETNDHTAESALEAASTTSSSVAGKNERRSSAGDRPLW
eukprot:TRINITY_DN59730_c0_g1_i2.p1 TRINITY_DN59730_c0_g1~~TRINITY_DN59730_c0_g1_i2.p1  ORF type:complete len:458 (+),score=50.73 TRINITY_DN59730_c0_g1_i2:91-1464(+)